MKPIQGLHHITAVAGDPQKNLDFYEQVLGQRLVKKTVNFDDPGTYHFYFGDREGTPGTIMTFFPWPAMSKGKPGIGETSAAAYSIPRDAVGYWVDRLERFGRSAREIERRFGEIVVETTDPDGMRLELIASERETTDTGKNSAVHHWNEGPVPEEYALMGFHSVTLWVLHSAPTASLLTDHLGFQRVGSEGDRVRYAAASRDMGSFVDLVEKPGMNRGAFGRGSIHHIAFRTVDDAEQKEYQTLVYDAGHGVTEVKDRQYFHSIYFREPGGVLFEIATDAPGFAYDEDVDHLGQSLKLPAWLESKRSSIEQMLPVVHRQK